MSRRKYYGKKESTAKKVLTVVGVTALGLLVVGLGLKLVGKDVKDVVNIFDNNTINGFTMDEDAVYNLKTDELEFEARVPAKVKKALDEDVNKHIGMVIAPKSSFLSIDAEKGNKDWIESFNKFGYKYEVYDDVAIKSHIVSNGKVDYYYINAGLKNIKYENINTEYIFCFFIQKFSIFIIKRLQNTLKMERFSDFKRVLQSLFLIRNPLSRRLRKQPPVYSDKGLRNSLLNKNLIIKNLNLINSFVRRRNRCIILYFFIFNYIIFKR